MFNYLNLKHKVQNYDSYISICIMLSLCQPLAFQNVNFNEIQNRQDEVLEVKIYYEALCPYSVLFMRQFLYDAMISADFLKYTDLKLVPYGKVKNLIDSETNQEYFICQHGLMECMLNALHGCIIQHHIQLEQLLLIDCLMARYTLEKCSKELNINISGTLICFTQRSIEDILKIYGDQTKIINLTEVPSIAIDGVFDYNSQQSLRLNFSNMFCAAYKAKYHIVLNNCTE